MGIELRTLGWHAWIAVGIEVVFCLGLYSINLPASRVHQLEIIAE